MRCGNCGNDEFQKASMKGKTFPWKDFTSVFISVDDLKLNQCQGCGEVRLSARKKEVEKLDQAIRDSIKHQIILFLKIIKQERHLSQKELCDIIRISPQHLSNIKSGNKEVSFQLYSLLKLLAEKPKLIDHFAAQYIPDFLRKVVGQ